MPASRLRRRRQNNRRRSTRRQRGSGGNENKPCFGNRCKGLASSLFSKAKNVAGSAAAAASEAAGTAASRALNVAGSAAAAASGAAGVAASRALNVAGSAARTVRNKAGTVASRAINAASSAARTVRNKAGAAASSALTITGLLLQVATFALVGMGFTGYLLYKQMRYGGFASIAPIAKVVFMTIGVGLVGAIQSLSGAISYGDMFTNEKLSLLLENYEGYKTDNKYCVSVLMYLTSENFNFHDASPKLKTDYIRIVSEILDNERAMDYYADLQKITKDDKENMMLVLRTQLETLKTYGVIADENSMNKILIREATKEAE